MKKVLASLVIVASLVGCSTTPINQVAAMQSVYTAVEKSALIYAKLPKCGTAGVVACRNPDVVKSIGTADNAAHNAIQAARASTTGDSIAAAQDALNAFQVIVNAVVNKGTVPKEQLTAAEVPVTTNTITTP